MMRKGGKKVDFERQYKEAFDQHTALGKAEQVLKDARMLAQVKLLALEAATAEHVQARLKVEEAKEVLLAEARSLVERGQ